MNYCNYCGSKLIEGAKFCNKCGKKLIKEEQKKEYDLERVLIKLPDVLIGFKFGVANFYANRIEFITKKGDIRIFEYSNMIKICKIKGNVLKFKYNDKKIEMVLGCPYKIADKCVEIAKQNIEVIDEIIKIPIENENILDIDQKKEESKNFIDESKNFLNYEMPELYDFRLEIYPIIQFFEFFQTKSLHVPKDVADFFEVPKITNENIKKLEALGLIKTDENNKIKMLIDRKTYYLELKKQCKLLLGCQEYEAKYLFVFGWMFRNTYQEPKRKQDKIRKKLEENNIDKNISFEFLRKSIDLYRRILESEYFLDLEQEGFNFKDFIIINGYVADSSKLVPQYYVIEKENKLTFFKYIGLNEWNSDFNHKIIYQKMRIEKIEIFFDDIDSLCIEGEKNTYTETTGGETFYEKPSDFDLALASAHAKMNEEWLGIPKEATLLRETQPKVKTTPINTRTIVDDSRRTCITIKDGKKYNFSLESYNILKPIIERHTSNTETKEVKNMSSADEIFKFKKLTDEGIITKEEFEKKKKELLNL